MARTVRTDPQGSLAKSGCMPCARRGLDEFYPCPLGSFLHVFDGRKRVSSCASGLVDEGSPKEFYKRQQNDCITGAIIVLINYLEGAESNNLFNCFH